MTQPFGVGLLFATGLAGDVQGSPLAAGDVDWQGEMPSDLGVNEGPATTTPDLGVGEDAQDYFVIGEEDTVVRDGTSAGPTDVTPSAEPLPVVANGQTAASLSLTDWAFLCCVSPVCSIVSVGALWLGISHIWRRIGDKLAEKIIPVRQQAFLAANSHLGANRQGPSAQGILVMAQRACDFGDAWTLGSQSERPLPQTMAYAAYAEGQAWVRDFHKLFPRETGKVLRKARSLQDKISSNLLGLEKSIDLWTYEAGTEMVRCLLPEGPHNGEVRVETGNWMNEWMDWLVLWMPQGHEALLMHLAKKDAYGMAGEIYFKYATQHPHVPSRRGELLALAYTAFERAGRLDRMADVHMKKFLTWREFGSGYVPEEGVQAMRLYARDGSLMQAVSAGVAAAAAYMASGEDGARDQALATLSQAAANVALPEVDDYIVDYITYGIPVIFGLTAVTLRILKSIPSYQAEEFWRYEALFNGVTGINLDLQQFVDWLLKDPHFSRYTGLGETLRRAKRSVVEFLEELRALAASHPRPNRPPAAGME